MAIKKDRISYFKENLKMSFSNQDSSIICYDPDLTNLTLKTFLKQIPKDSPLSIIAIGKQHSLTANSYFNILQFVETHTNITFFKLQTLHPLHLCELYGPSICESLDENRQLKLKNKSKHQIHKPKQVLAHSHNHNNQQTKRSHSKKYSHNPYNHEHYQTNVIHFPRLVSTKCLYMKYAK